LLPDIVKSLAEAATSNAAGSECCQERAQAADEDLSWRVPDDDKASDRHVFIAPAPGSITNIYHPS
jgi:hypothetical protein